MHRIRVHNIQYPLYGSRQKESGSSYLDYSSSPVNLGLGLTPVGIPFLGSLPGGSFQENDFGSHDRSPFSLQLRSIIPEMENTFHSRASSAAQLSEPSVVADRENTQGVVPSEVEVGDTC